jgi:hypothetical protein
MKRILLLLPLFLACIPAYSQVAYEDINNIAIYDFLDEMADLRIISLNSAIKPYSRDYIASKLKDILLYDSQNIPQTRQLTN